MTTPLFPGGVAVSDLAVYDWEAADGRCGGSPHLHTASSEGYVVVGGAGVGAYAECRRRRGEPAVPGRRGLVLARAPCTGWSTTVGFG